MNYVKTAIDLAGSCLVDDMDKDAMMAADKAMDALDDEKRCKIECGIRHLFRLGIHVGFIYGITVASVFFSLLSVLVWKL